MKIHLGYGSPPQGNLRKIIKGTHATEVQSLPHQRACRCRNFIKLRHVGERTNWANQVYRNVMEQVMNLRV